MGFFDQGTVPAPNGTTRNVGDVDQSDANDALYMAGRLLPGELDLSDIARELAKQHKRGSGDDGAEPHFRGLKACDFTVTLKLHTDEQVESWFAIRPLLIDYNNPQNRNEVSVSYPLLSEASVDRCVVHKVSSKRPTAGGPLVVTISCSSVKRKSGSSNTPKQTKILVGGAATLIPYRPGFGPRPRVNLLPLNVRTISALEQARIDNGIPASIALDPVEGLANQGSPDANAITVNSSSRAASRF